MTLNELKDKLKQFRIELTDIQLSQLDNYAYFLKEYNEKINLTAITEYSEII